MGRGCCFDSWWLCMPFFCCPFFVVVVFCFILICFILSETWIIYNLCLWFCFWWVFLVNSFWISILLILWRYTCIIIYDMAQLSFNTFMVSSLNSILPLSAYFASCWNVTKSFWWGIMLFSIGLHVFSNIEIDYREFVSDIKIKTKSSSWYQKHTVEAYSTWGPTMVS